MSFKHPPSNIRNLKYPYHPALLVAVCSLAIHFSLNGYHGYMRDELYFIACGNHLDWGYVDVGPLTIWLGRLSTAILGQSLFALRFFPALAHAATILLAAAMARRLGAGLWGQFIAAFSILIAPIWLLASNILSLPAFEPLFWMLAALSVLLVIQTGNSRYWLMLGAATGFGLLNKPSMLFFIPGLFAGLLFTPHRKYFKDKWLYLSALLALGIASPYIYWQFTHDWATLRFMLMLNRDIMSGISPVQFLVGQLFYMHPVNVLITLSALAWLFRSESGRPYRILGWVFLTVFLFLLVVRSKIYYLAPAYPMLLASGAAAWDAWLSRPNRLWAKWAISAAMAAIAAVIAPIVLPILPINRLDGYLHAVTGGVFRNIYEINQTFHDMIGWEEQVRAVADIYNRLPPEERAECLLVGANFGVAGAIDFYGPKYGLPKAWSLHQNYYFWGPPEKFTKVAIVVDADKEDLDLFFRSVELAGVFRCPMAAKKEVSIHVCREPKMTPQELWTFARDLAFRN